jgi:hypothetical protein
MIKTESQKLDLFISHFWSYDISKITPEKTLDSIGMYGDDKRDFFNLFFTRFNIKCLNFNYDNYCEPENFNPFRLLFKNKNSNDITTVSIGHLHKVIEKGIWFDSQS